MNNFTLIKLEELEDQNLFFDFCKQAFLEKDQPAHINMWDDDWQSKNNTLPYLLFNKDRFKMPNGAFHLLLEDNKIVACAGVYKSEFSDEVSIAGVRTWVNKEYRNSQVLRNYILPEQKKWSIENGFKTIALSFNDYNKNIISTWKRIRLGERRSTREPKHLFYNNFNELTYPVNVQNTKQWVIYEVIDPQFSFDWNSIKHLD